jgi:uncharacterized protein (DUF433 family)
MGLGIPQIESDPDITGGEARIIRTRIPVWLLVQARRLGMSDNDLLKSYPTLRPEDLVNAWMYAGLIWKKSNDKSMRMRQLKLIPLADGSRGT